jgi:DNA-binding MarR family transcriptional regulator
MTMTDLNPIIHQPVRLRIVAALDALQEGESVEFTFLRDLLELTDGNLGAHLRKLEDADYVEIEKTFVQRKPRTFISLRPHGRRAYREHVKALESIIKGDA